MLADLKLYKESYNFLLYMYPEIKKFPKSDKFTLGEDIKRLIFSLLSNIIIYSKQKIYTLNKADENLELLRIYIRLSFDLNIISFKKYEIMSLKLNNMGNLLGGLIKRTL